jgi:hypothetical protein
MQIARRSLVATRGLETEREFQRDRNFRSWQILLQKSAAWRACLLDPEVAMSMVVVRSEEAAASTLGH